MLKVSSWFRSRLWFFCLFALPSRVLHDHWYGVSDMSCRYLYSDRRIIFVYSLCHWSILGPWRLILHLVFRMIGRAIFVFVPVVIINRYPNLFHPQQLHQRASTCVYTSELLSCFLLPSTFISPDDIPEDSSYHRFSLSQSYSHPFHR